MRPVCYTVCMETLSYLWLHILLPAVLVVGVLAAFVLFLSALHYAMERWIQWLVDHNG